MSPEALAKGDDGSVVEAAYYMIRREGMDVTVLPEYRLGKEYPKTYGHFHKPPAEEKYEILLGEVGMLLQKGTDPVEEVKLVRLKKGDTITTPKGYAHCMINLGVGPAVTLDDHDSSRCENDYLPIKAKRGFAYYIVEEDGEMKAVANPNYAQVPPLEIVGGTQEGGVSR